MFRIPTLLMFVISFAAGIWSGICAQTSQPADSAKTAPDTLHYEMDEVVVTATRYEKKIIDIPYSVTRVENRQFAYNRKVGVNDVLSSVPGLFLQSRYGNHDVRISIRGFGSRSNSGIRGVRILLDGIPESEPDGQTRIEAIDFNSVGRIEIVKGNASSLYPNAPGGVINFINDIYFPSTFFVNFNEFGSFGLRRNGFKTGIRTKNYAFLLTYSNHNFDGYRKHSEDYWHIVNTVLETTPNERSDLQILGYFVDGHIRLPGSLTREEYRQNPLQAAQREIDFDFRRVSKKGRVGLRFRTFFDHARNNQLEITAYGTIKYFERTSRVYRIINRFGLGASFRFVNRGHIFGRRNEFSVGGDLLHQTGPIEFYTNINGKKSDVLTGLTDETIGNRGIFFQNSLNLYRNKLDVLLTGRYDQVIFDQKNQLLAAQNDRRTFDAFTPKIAFNYKFTPYLGLYTSFGLSFESPAGNELDNYPLSSNPGKLINPDLQPQNAQNFELGMKGNFYYPNRAFFNRINFEATVFHSTIDDEVVPFEIFNDVFFRNSARTNRSGLETGWHATIFRGLSWELAYTYSHFKYAKYLAQTIELDNSGNVVTAQRDFSGNFAPSVPRHNLSTALSFAQPFTNNITAFVRGNYFYIDGLYVDDANSDKSKGYHLLNTTLGLDMLFDRINILISGGIQNILDQDYVAFVNINSTSKRFYEAGMPRNYFVTFKWGYTF